ncbi:MAG: hypothetical protein ACIARR_03640 [Phycisphaerales bacterium JB059]
MRTDRDVSACLIAPLAGSALALALLAGCASESGGPSSSSAGEVNTGLARLGDEEPQSSGVEDGAFADLDDDEMARMIEESAKLLSSIYDEPEAEPEAAPSPSSPRISVSEPGEAAPDPSAFITDVTPIEEVSASGASSTLASLGAGQPAAPAPPTATDPSFIEMIGGAPETPAPDAGVEFLAYLGADPEPVVERVSASGRSHEELAAELSRSLRELVRDADDPGEAFRAAAALAGLEAIHPGSIDRLEEEGVLSPEEMEVVKAAAELTRAIGREGQLSDPGQAADTLDELSERLSSARGVRIGTALLCTRVVGFGQYEEFPTNTFLAGRRQPVIIYTEMDRFTHKPITGEDGETRYEIQLSQRLELYHLADGLNTWNRAAEVDRTVSRKKVNDYYLINQVVLPSTLSVGRYALKVVMRDLNDERGSVDEVTIPIEIVSDPALAYPNVSRASARP